MAYSELDRTYIRHFLGYGAIFLQAEPRLENAILATQSVADLGARPDSSTENFVKGLIYGVAAVAGAQTGVVPGGTAQNVLFATPATPGMLAIEQQLASMWTFAYAIEADREAKVDTFRGMVQLRTEGRRLANHMARILGMRGVRCDMFAPGTPITDDDPWNDPFAYSNAEHWRRGP